MLTRIRDILAREYIGAIIIGMLTAHGIMALLNGLAQPLHFFIRTRGMPEGIQGAEGLFGGWDWLHWAVGLLIIAIYFLTAYALLFWIYVRPTSAAKVVDESEEFS
jgi:hypothetical protein